MLNLIVQTSGNFDDRVSTLNSGNMRSRMRMVALYTTCRQWEEQKGGRVRVVGTGNYSEDAIGFQTKGGDNTCDFFPLGSLFKSEVYQLLEYFRDTGLITEEMINRTPSPGLWDGHLDETELGFRYNDIEPSLRRLMVGEVDKTNELDNKVYQMYLSGLHKVEPAPVFQLREFCD